MLDNKPQLFKASNCLKLYSFFSLLCISSIIMFLNASTNHCTSRIITFSISFRNRITPVSWKNFSAVIRSCLLFQSWLSSFWTSSSKFEKRQALVTSYFFFKKDSSLVQAIGTFSPQWFCFFNVEAMHSFNFSMFLFESFSTKNTRSLSIWSRSFGVRHPRIFK